MKQIWLGRKFIFLIKTPLNKWKDNTNKSNATVSTYKEVVFVNLW